MARWTRKSKSGVRIGSTPTAVSTSSGGIRVAVVGSGPAGIFCADRLAELAQEGHANICGPVHLFRSRSKLSASQMEGEHNTLYPRPGAAFFDYGCQYITAGDPWFVGKMLDYEKHGLCHPWSVGVLSRECGYVPSDQCAGWVGTQGMWVLQENIVQYIATERKAFLELHHALDSWPPPPGCAWRDSTAGPNANQLMVTRHEKHEDGTWTLHNRRGDAFGPFDVLIGAYYSHVHTDQQLRSEATRPMRDYLHRNLKFAPLIVIWVTFHVPLELSFNAAFVCGDERLVWAANNNSKVGNGCYFEAEGRELWTLIASTKYSFASVSKDAQGYKRRAFVDMITAFQKSVGKDLWSHQPKLIRANHWGGAIPCTTLPSDSGCIFDSKQSLGWCGSWATYNGVEGAAVSGKRMAELIANLSRGEVPPGHAEYPPGNWMDMGSRASTTKLCIDHGFFHVKHQQLHSVMLLPGIGPEPEALQRCMQGWVSVDVSGERSTSNAKEQKGPVSSGLPEKHGKGKSIKHSNRRWVARPSNHDIPDAQLGG